MKTGNRYITGIIIVAIMLILAIAVPVAVSLKALPILTINAVEMAKRGKSDDPPWDPGDESAKTANHKSSLSRTSALIIPGDSDFGVLMAKKDDPPWDPGDETHKEVAYVKYS
ncbi:MAG: hypothetical protein NTY09_05380 [bacterium]|nr:hypothetical protein [bacterium]